MFKPFVLKIGRNSYTITESDRVVFDGNCYQLVTQNYRCRLSVLTPVLAKTKAEKWVSQGYLVEHSHTDLFGSPLLYYRFTGNPESKV